MRSRSFGNGRRRRPRAVWIALATAVVLCAATVAGILLPVLGLIGAVGATTFGTLHIPVGTIAAGIVISYLIALVLVVLTFLSKFGPLAWIAAVAAVIATLVGSVWPLVATAFASVSQVQDVIPFIQELIAKVSGNG
ncbi:hypothetical protein [Frondihabitans cladoniiphilus]|uniref:Superfamily IV 4 TMS phage holin n=1 Tax=Frondihabitans cladoniiphilus TaxID=715785 RepID=A0ABP8VLU6_9MICO